ncbi:MAG: rhamnulokinase family protein [Phycisphaerales bacterium JB063]
MASTSYLAVDLGAESGRVIVGILDDGRLTLHEAHRFLHNPVDLPSGLHWDLTGLWHNIIEGLRVACDWCSEHGHTPSSVGVDTWGVDFALLGHDGELVHMPHAYRDPRNDAAHGKLLEALGKEKLYDRTGIQFMALNTLPQLVASHEADPGLLARADRLLFVPDLLHYWLTGVAKVEATIASTSQMVDPRGGGLAWATDLLEAMGLPTQMLGDIVPPGTIIGPLRDAVAQRIGAPGGMVVTAPAAHDTASAIAAVPVDLRRGNWCYLSSGTWSLMGAELDAPVLTDAARDTPFTNEGGVGGTIRFLKNIIGLWLVQEIRRDYEHRGENYDYPTLAKLAENAKPFVTLLDPGYAPFSKPTGMLTKIADYAAQSSQPVPETPGAFVRAALESLALTYRRTLEQLEAVLDTRYDVLHVVGGGGKNELLNRMTADAIGRPVVVGPYEATAAGNVLVQAMGAGDLSHLAAARKVVADSFEPVRYAPQETAEWDAAYARFGRLLRE